MIVLTLTGCSTFSVKTEPTVKPSLDISIPGPVSLRPVEWNVLIIENTPYYALDAENFENLSVNTEILQNRLNLQRNIILKQKEYYENP